MGEVRQHDLVYPNESCPPYKCGNSPEIDHHGMHELNVRGLPNLQGLTIDNDGDHAQLWKGGVAYRLEVVDGKLRGLTGNQLVVGGQQLVGAEFRIRSGGAVLYRVVVRRVRDVTYYAGPIGTKLEAYVLHCAPIGPPSAPTENLCISPAHADDGDGAGAMGLMADEAVLFEGDRIDAFTKRIEYGYDAAWFNVGCAGHTLAKLHLTGNSGLARGAQAPETFEARKATLKLLTADYCGTGRAFTVAGERLYWRSDNMGYADVPDRLEARWTSAGASCLNEPRVAVSVLATAHAEFPDIEEAIRLGCTRPPPCVNDQVDDMDSHERMSANPAAPY